MEKYTLGLDIGITSIGWCIIQQEKKKLIDLGVRMFEEAAQAKESRKNRSARRNLSRKRWRKNQLLDAFDDFGILSKEITKNNEFLCFTTENAKIHRPIDETVYHLRKRALKEKVSKRELFLCLYNICGTRGHFLMENIDFANNSSIDADYFVEKFHELVDEYVLFSDAVNEFDKNVLVYLFEKGSVKSNELKSLIKENYTNTLDDHTSLIELMKLLCGYACDLNKIDEKLIIDDWKNKKSIKLEDIIKSEADLPYLLNGIVELHDVIVISKILTNHDFICEVAVEKLDKVKEIYPLEFTDPEIYEQKRKEIQSKMNGKLNNRLRVVKNMENKFPNGLYVKEARCILETQKKYYPEINDEFITACIATIRARIPYFIGPLSENAKNAWLVKTGKFKYGYDYCKNFAVNEEESIKRWKEAMISRCTYLPDEFALPKGSFLAETFSIVNELNVLYAIDKNDNEYYLTQDDKFKLFDELFLRKNGSVTLEEIADKLNLKSFGPRVKTKSSKFNNQYSLYHKIISAIPDLKLNSIEEIFTDKSKIEKIENIILNLSLFDEEESKLKYFIDEMKISLVEAKKLAKLKSNGFYSFSKKFVMSTPMNRMGESMLDLLFESNIPEFKNEQMTIITNATDLDGNKVNFTANKYIKKLEKTRSLSIDLLIDNGKPFIPISRSVIRSLNECFKLYEEIINTYGVPDRVVIETARDLKDSSGKGEIPAKHFDKMKGYYDYLIKEVKEQKSKNKFIKVEVADWNEIEKHLVQNKKKIELYIRQNGKDMISGEIIDIHNLQDYEIDHILPRGFGDNSMDNLMLINRLYNAKKSNRVPLEYIEQDEVRTKDGKIVTTSNFVARCNELFEMRLISENKLNQLLLTSTENALGFINRNLVDTRYIIRELMSILRAYNKVNGYKTHIVALKSAFTSVYRNAFNMRKNRDIGVQHHAHDAAIVAVTDHVLSAYYPNYDSRGNMKQYREFLNQILIKEKDSRKSELQKLNNFIRSAYIAAYNDAPEDEGSLISQIKSLRPLYSIKEEKNYKGAYFKATILPKEELSKGPLEILDVNNSKHIFTSINCAAVDFYKYTNKKGKRVHAAIHIPKVIVDQDGNINQKQYIKLIKDYYGIPELIDEKGNLKEYYFKFRAYKNELIYDTNQQTIQKFNIGSIKNKKLEMKHMYIFSYNEIYNNVEFLDKVLSVYLNLKSFKYNPKGTEKVSGFKVEKGIKICLENLLIEVDDLDKYKKAITDYLSKSANYQDFLERCAFINLIVNRNCTPPTIIGQYMPTAGTPGDNADYVKLKYSVLGIRYSYNNKGNLVINGPNKAAWKFSKIKKEEFSWNLKRKVL